MGSVYDLVFGITDDGRLLLGKDWCAARVTDGGGLESVAELVNFQRHLMRDAGIVRLALVVIGERLAFVSEQNRVAVVLGGLNHTQRIGVFGGAVRVCAVG